jgi:hypothetical protein
VRYWRGEDDWSGRGHVTGGGKKVIGSAVVSKTEYNVLFIEIQLFTEIQCLHLYDIIFIHDILAQYLYFNSICIQY